MLPGDEFDWLKYELTHRERQIAELLRTRFGKTVTKENIHATVYFKSQDPPELKIVDIFVCKIRTKLAMLGCPYNIDTVWGDGYRMLPAAECSSPECTKPAAAYVPKKNRPPRLGSVLWEGFALGARQAQLARRLSEKCGKFSRITHTEASIVPSLRRKLDGHYVIEGKWGLGYCMRQSVVGEALRNLKTNEA